MAKSSRSKVKKRWRSLRRKVVEQEQVQFNVDNLNTKIQATIKGQEYREKPKKNGFLHPNDEDAVFHQHVPQKMLDFRSANIPYAGLEFAGSKRKKINNASFSEAGLKIIQEQEEKEIEMGNDDEEEIMKFDGKKLGIQSVEVEGMGMEEESVFKPTKNITKKQQMSKGKKRKSKKIMNF